MTPNTWRATGRNAPRRPGRARPALERLEERTVPAYVATVAGAEVVFLGDAVGDLLLLDVDPTGFLRHNRFGVDFGFASPIDLVTALPGTQALLAGAVSTLTVNAGEGNDIVRLAPLLALVPSALNGQGGNDLLEGANPFMDGGEGNDVLIGTAGNDTLIGGGGNDQLFPGGGIDAVSDGPGDDLIEFGSSSASVTYTTEGGNDTLLGSAFDDLLMGRDGNDHIEGRGGNDVISGMGGNDNLFGGAGIDALAGGPGVDRLSGGDDADSFTWDPGFDSEVIDGDGGFDTLVFRGSAAPEAFNLSSVSGRLQLLRDVGGIILDVGTVEQVNLSMLAGADVATLGDLDGSGVSVLNIDAGAGDGAPDFVGVAGRPINDGLAITTPAAGAVSVAGLAYSVLIGSLEPARDSLSVDGAGGNDVLDAGRLPAGVMPNLFLRGGDGADVLLGSAGVDDLDGGPGNDTLVGGPADDTMTGGDGDDAFVRNDGDGSDRIEGGAGNDTAFINGSNLGDAFTIRPAASDRVEVRRSNLGAYLVDIGTTELVVVSGLDGEDSFGVTPAPFTTILAQGGNPTTPPGDSLTVDIAGATDPVLPPPGVSEGSYTFSNRAPVMFNGMESVTPTAPGPPVPPVPPVPPPPIPPLPPPPIPPPPGPPIPPPPIPPSPPPPPSPPIVPIPAGGFAVGPGPGGGTEVLVFNPDGTSAFGFSPFAAGASPGGVRVAVADVTGDGTPDLIAGTGPGVRTQVRVFDGATRDLVFTLDPFEASFTGGVFVAAGDINGDGRAELAVTPDEGGGPRVRVFDGDGFTQIADFFGIEDSAFRGGARPGLGDLNGDGAADLLVAAGFGGGPRVAAYDGAALAGGSPEKLFGDIFLFEDTLRNGVFVTAGDINGDGFADLIAGAGPGGGPRVFALSGRDLVESGAQVAAANFFAGDPADRGGVRVATRQLGGGATDDLLTGGGVGSRVAAYLGDAIPSEGTPPEFFAFDAFPGFAGGVFVG